MPTTTDARLRQILTEVRTIAVVGFSADPARPSHEVARFLADHGYRVTGVNPGLAGRTIAGIPVVARLEDLDGPVDMVDVFRRAEETPPIAAAAIVAGARVLWLQLGVVNETAKAMAEAGGLTVVMDRCPKIEIPRLGL